MELNFADIPPENVQGKPIAVPFRSLKLSYSQLKLGQPYRFNDPTALHQEVYPQECRLAGKTYSAPLLAEITR